MEEKIKMKPYIKRKKRRIHPYDPNLSKKIDKKLEINLHLLIFGLILMACLI